MPILRFAVASVCATIQAAPVLTVSGGSGSAARLQAAVDSCPADGCTIQLHDARYEMENQVWIVGRSDISFVGTSSTRPVLTWADSLLVPDANQIAKLFKLRPPAGGGRPTLQAGWLMWPSAGLVGPGTLADSANPWAKEGFQHNGMFLVKESRRVAFRHLSLEGSKSAAFAVKGVWGRQWDLYHGSVGVSFLRSFAGEISDCDIARFWSAVYMNGRNPECAPWRGSGDPAQAAGAAWKACGRMGAHLVERSRLLGNWYGVYSESEWDMGSVVRENLVWDNANQAIRAPSTTIASTNARNGLYQLGGFVHVKDVAFPAHVFSHNTAIDNVLAYGHAGYRAGNNSLWTDNILSVPESFNSEPTGSSWMQNFEQGTRPHLWNTTILHAGSGSGYAVGGIEVVDSMLRRAYTKLVPRDTVPGVVAGGRTLVVGIDTFSILLDTIPDTASCAKGCWVTPENNEVLMRNWSLPLKAQVVPGDWWQAQVRNADGSLLNVRTWIPTFSDSVGAIRMGNTSAALAAGYQLLHCRNCEFASMNPSDSAFLRPVRKAGSKAAFGQGYRGAARGAHDLQGRIGGHVPVRVRATGVPRLLSNGRIGLPLEFHSVGGPVSHLVVVRGEIRARSIEVSPSNVVHSNERVLDSLPKGSVEAGGGFLEMSLPASKDSIFQFDLWFAGISGGDTLDATPLSWSWATRMAETQTVSVARWEASRPLPRFHAGSGVLSWEGRRSSVELVSVSGRRHSLPADCVMDACSADLSSLPAGVWTPLLPGARAIPRI